MGEKFKKALFVTVIVMLIVALVQYFSGLDNYWQVPVFGIGAAIWVLFFKERARSKGAE